MAKEEHRDNNGARVTNKILQLLLYITLVTIGMCAVGRYWIGSL